MMTREGALVQDGPEGKNSFTILIREARDNKFDGLLRGERDTGTEKKEEKRKERHRVTYEDLAVKWHRRRELFWKMCARKRYAHPR